MVYPMNLAIKITLLRIILTPLIVISIFYGQWLLALILAVVAGLTDFLDGYVARRYNQETEFGKMLDPVADKIFIFSTLSVLYVTLGTADIPSWFMMIFLGKELLLIFGAWFLVSHRYGIISPSFISKLMTALLMIFIMYLIATHSDFIPDCFSYQVMKRMFQFFAGAMMIICVDYGYKVYKILQGSVS